MEGTQEIVITISDEQFVRLMDVQENDKVKQDECALHIFELGLSARENSIKATNKRKSQEQLAKNLDAFNKFLKLAPETVQDSAKLLKVMQSFGLAINSLPQEVAAAKSA